jgi:hypothetical protein
VPHPLRWLLARLVAAGLAELVRRGRFPRDVITAAEFRPDGSLSIRLEPTACSRR